MIKDLRELQALLKLCRKQGVTDITVGGVSIKFGDLPPRKAGEPEKDEETETEAAPDPDPLAPTGLTPEQLMFFSVGGGPLP